MQNVDIVTEPQSFSLPPSSQPEASKYMLQYLALCSGHAGEVDRVKNRLIQSNPVLEVRRWPTPEDKSELEFPSCVILGSGI